MPDWFLILILITPGQDALTIGSIEPMPLAECEALGKSSAEALSLSLPGSLVGWTCERAGETL